MSLVHIADSDVPDGFLPGKPRLFGTQILLPASPESRRRVLLETMRLVGYLYDMPAETLDELLRHATVLDCKRNDVIIHKGPVDPRGAPCTSSRGRRRVSVRTAAAWSPRRW